jgi:hypothetical protein
MCALQGTGRISQVHSLDGVLDVIENLELTMKGQCPQISETCWEVLGHRQ